MYHPIAQGEIDGRKDGLQSDLDLFSFVLNADLDFNEFRGDYWIGFGAGYAAGQTLRNQFKKYTAKATLEEYIDWCQYLFVKTQICRTSPQDYLDNVKNWDQLQIDYAVCEKSLKWLANHQLQRALHEIVAFYKTNFRLKALREIDPLLEGLKNLRTRKKKEKNDDISAGKAEIVLALKSWINTYGTPQTNG